MFARLVRLSRPLETVVVAVISAVGLVVALATASVDFGHALRSLRRTRHTGRGR